MKRLSVLIAVLSISVFLFSCNGDRSPISSPTTPPELTAETTSHGGSQTHLWGFYDVYIDIPTQTATAILDRQAMFSANVVNFLNGKPANLGFHINDTPIGPDYIDVDIDVSLTHPFPGLTQYNGYDARGVFMGDGSASMSYNPALIYPMLGTDQYMLADPDIPLDDNGAPDGCTRWFNWTEFSKGGMPLFQYTQGKIASPSFAGTATLCPYKYFADDLSKDDDLWTWLNDPSNGNPTGVFGAGQANTRNYYLRFPNAKGVKFGYAVIADWKGTNPESHPANAPEAIAVSVIDNSDIYYANPSANGGNLKLDLSVWDWDAEVSGGVMHDYKIFIESTVLTYPYEATTADMTPTGGDENYSTYHIEIPSDGVPGPEGNEYWVIVECSDADYSNDFDVQNDAWSDPLAALFRYPIIVGSASPPVAKAKIETTAPYHTCQAIHFMDDGSNDPDGTIVKYEWDWNNDGIFDETGPDVYHTFDSAGPYTVQFRVTDNDGLTDTLDTALSFSVDEIKGWAKTWGGPFVGADGSSDQARYVSLDSSGNIFVAGQFQGTNVDMDPSTPGSDLHSSIGGLDAFLIKFDSCGAFLWARTWGGPSDEASWTVVADSQGNAVVMGSFAGTVDFDPSAGSNVHSSVGEGDCFVSKFGPDGDFLWAETWGCGSYDNAHNAAIGPSDSIYVAGEWFYGSIDLNPDPSESDVHPLIGASDRYVAKLTSTGDYLWGQSWGGGLWDGGTGLAVDGQGNAYVCGHFRGSVDFDPDPGMTDYIACVDYPSASGVVSKFDTTGDYKWARKLAGDVPSYPSGVWLNSDASRICIAGSFNGVSADFDPGAGTDMHSANGGNDIFVTVYDPSGAFQWARTWGGTNNDDSWHISGDAAGNIIVGGRFSSSGMDFDPGVGTDIHSTNGGLDCFINKFNSSGAFQWARTWGGSTGDDSVLALGGGGGGGGGGVYASGYFVGTTDFDPGSGTDNHVASGTTDAFLCRFGSDGNW